MSGRGYRGSRGNAGADSDDEEDDDEEEDETGDFLGTPLEPLEDSDEERTASAAKRAKLRQQSSLPVHQQQVLDERGRPLRFHGAFTGGFSAGHFNTVGTQEGFQPAEFRSSRRDRQEQQQQDGGRQQQRRPEDFMDAEDLGQFGIAPREVRARPDYDGAGLRRQMLARAAATAPDPLAELLLPSETDLGDRLLRRLGWRPDRGCGDDEAEAEDAGSQPRPETTTVTAATDLLARLRLKPSRDTHGVGYLGLDAGRALLSAARAAPAAVAGIRGQAFGVGALETEDADVYHTDSLANYDFTIGTEAEEAALSGRRDNFGWTAPASGGPSRTGVRDADDEDAAPLDGFVRRHGDALRRAAYPPPVLPPDFAPVHRPAPQPDALDVALRQLRAEAEEASESALPKPPITTAKKPPAEHVAGLKASRWDVGAPTKVSAASPSAPAPAPTPLIAPAPPNAAAAAPPTASAPLTSARWHQQFGEDPAKQARFHSYLRWRGAGASASGFDPYEKAAAGTEGLTDWERHLERDQFTRAAAEADQRGPASLNSRFRAEGATEEAPVVPASSGAGNGRPVRRVSEWRPHAMVCRRLNVPNPFPDPAAAGASEASSSAGRRDNRTSVFDLLTVTTSGDSSAGKPKPQALFACLFDEGSERVETKQPAAATATVVASESDDAVAAAVPASKTSVAIAVATATAPAALVESSRPSMDLFKSIFSSEDEEDEAELETTVETRKEEKSQAGDETVPAATAAATFERQSIAATASVAVSADSAVPSVGQSTSRMLAASSLFAHLFEDQPPPPPPPAPLQPPPPLQIRQQVPKPPPPPPPPAPLTSTSASTSASAAASDVDREIRRLEKKLKKELKKDKKLKKKQRKTMERTSSSATLSDEDDGYEFVPVTKAHRS